MWIELPVRWAEKKKLDKDEAQLKKLLGEEEEISDEEESGDFSYGRVVLDTKDIRTYNELDEGHIILRTYFNDSYCIGVPFNDFKRLMAELLGVNVTVIQKKVVKEDSKAKKKTKGDTSHDDNIIL